MSWDGSKNPAAITPVLEALAEIRKQRKKGPRGPGRKSEEPKTKENQ